jgi:hypothetical protein
MGQRNKGGLSEKNIRKMRKRKNGMKGWMGRKRNMGSWELDRE